MRDKISGARNDMGRAALKKVSGHISEHRPIQAAFEKSVPGGLPDDIFAGMARKYEEEKQELTETAEQLNASIRKHSRTEN